MPKKDNGNDKLIEILNPEKKVAGLSWEDLHKALVQKGWKDAEKDNYLRAAFNLCDTSNPQDGITEALGGYAGGTINYDPEHPEYAEELIRHAVRDDIINSAKVNKNFTIDENKRESVLFFQDELNRLEHEKFDFNKYYPKPVAEGNDVLEDQAPADEGQKGANDPEDPPKEDNQDNEELQGHAQEENQEQAQEEHQEHAQEEDQVQNQAENLMENEDDILIQNPDEAQGQVAEPDQPGQRILPDIQKITRDAGYFELLFENATLRGRGSSEFKNAREEFIRVQAKWKLAVAAPGGKVREEELLSLRADVMNAMRLADIYLDKKYRGNDKSFNAQKRTNVAQKAFDLLEEQLAILDARREEIQDFPAPGLDVLAETSRAVMEDMQRAEVYLRGSSEYNSAEKAFRTVDKKLAQLSEKYQGSEGQITEDELEEVREMLMSADDLLMGYEVIKTGETVSERTHARTDAMARGRTLIAAALRKINELGIAKREEYQNANAQADPLQKMESVNTALTEAQEGVKNGSAQYAAARDKYQKLREKITEFMERNEQLSEDELDELTVQLDETEKSINAYLERKRGEELSPKTQRRVDAMRRAKESVIKIRISSDNRREVFCEEAKGKDVNELQQHERAVQGMVAEAQKTVNGRKVFGGGKDYDKALEAYSNAILHEAQRDATQRELSKYALEAQVEELQKAKEAALVYIRRKEQEKAKSRDGQLDEKGEKRLEVMTEAYRNIRTRLYIAEDKLASVKERETKEQQAQIKNLTEKRKAAIGGKTGMDKIMAMVISNDTAMLAEMSQKKTLTESDKEFVKNATARMMLADMIENGTIRQSLQPTLTSFEKYAVSIAKSAEFKAAFPKDKQDPDFCKKLLTDKAVLGATTRNFKSIVRKSGNQKKRDMLVKKSGVQKENVPGKK